MFCLVAIHGVVGEETLMPHLAELSGTKVKFFFCAAVDSSVNSQRCFFLFLSLHHSVIHPCYSNHPTFSLKIIKFMRGRH